MNAARLFGAALPAAIFFASGCARVERFCGTGRAAKAANAPIKKEHVMDINAPYPEITREDLAERLTKGAIVAVDANGTESYKEAHIPGAIDFAADSPNWPKGLPVDRAAPLVAYCGGPKCMAWKAAADALRKLGYTDVSHYPGGISEWTDYSPRCSLSPEAQSARTRELRDGLFKHAAALEEKPGLRRYRFPDDANTVADLTEFIRAERICCRPVRFGLEWEPDSGPITLEIQGPETLLSAMKAVEDKE